MHCPLHNGIDLDSTRSRSKPGFTFGPRLKLRLRFSTVERYYKITTINEYVILRMRLDFE